jgi:hypothetical protein
MRRIDRTKASTHVIRVRDLGSTYMATGGGQRTTCTQGAINAAHRHADKLFGNRHFNLNPVAGQPNTWRATACQEIRT